jgi:hypothetical protein
MSVLLIESDFSDISVCTFWLPASSPLRTYRMRTHTTKAWTNASIYFYAATAGSDGGSYRLANVSLHSNPALASDRTDCVDALAPAPAAVADGPELLKNGRFDTGTTSDWSLFGQIVSQVSGGVFEFYRPQASPDPAGVILQPTGVPLAAGDVLTAQFDLGNSSNVRKRVTVLLHDNSFLDLHACTFWLAPGQPLSSYQMRSYATQAWTNATISIYAASAGDPAWMRLDNVSLRKTSSVTTVGADCLEPGSTDIGAAPASEGAGVANESLDGVLVFRRAEARRLREL